jgi:hypothetical protein
MSRLICLSLATGQIVALGQTRYRVIDRVPGRPVLRLAELDGVTPDLQISLNELASHLVLEEATLIDELDIPDPQPGPGSDPGPPSAPNGVNQKPEMAAQPSTGERRIATDLWHLPLPRILDWHAKIYILKCLMRLRSCSPKSRLFRATVVEAQGDLDEWEAWTGAACAKRWSAWTLYHDLLRWRQQRYDMAAIQSKGVEYAPWVNRVSPFYVEVLKLAQTTGLEFPHETKASIHKRVHKRLATASLSQREAAQ